MDMLSGLVCPLTRGPCPAVLMTSWSWQALLLHVLLCVLHPQRGLHPLGKAWPGWVYVSLKSR